MLFMNRWEIDQAAERHRHHPILSRATQLLVELRDLADQNSDGWAYWPKPARAAKRLMELIQRPEMGVSEEALKSAARPIKAFCARHKLPFPAATLEQKQLPLPIPRSL